jgi:hypothetical protein
VKKVYNLGDDMFLAVAFVTFAIGVVLRLLGIYRFEVVGGVVLTAETLIRGAIVCLLFSIALSLYDLAQQRIK